MMIFGSEAIGLSVLYGIVPVTLLYFFRKSMVLPYAIGTFWLNGLFLLSLKLYFYIPYAFAGAKLHAPQWAGGLIIFAVSLIVFSICAVMIGKIVRQYKAALASPVISLFVFLACTFILVPVLIISYTLLTGKGDYGSYRTLLSFNFWAFFAVAALLLELIESCTPLKVPAIFPVSTAILLLVGAIMPHWLYIKLHITKDYTPLLDLTPYFRYRFFLIMGLMMFATGLIIAVWRNRKAA